MLMMGNRQRGFTIVELLIVVVVIAILAAITVVAFNGIQNRAKESQLQAHLSQALKKVEVFATTNNEQYPTSISACPSPGATQLCLEAPDGGTATYWVENAATPQSFCADVTKD